MVNKEYKNSNL